MSCEAPYTAPPHLQRHGGGGLAHTGTANCGSCSSSSQLNVAARCGGGEISDLASHPPTSALASSSIQEKPSSAAAAAPHLLRPGLQNSRRARGVVVWAALRQLGRRGVAEMVDGCCRHTRQLAAVLEVGAKNSSEIPFFSNCYQIRQTL
jgi:hypothetical protein